MEPQNKGKRTPLPAMMPPPPPPPPLVPPPPSQVHFLTPTSSNLFPSPLPEFLQGYPFDLQIIAPKKHCPEAGIDVMKKYGPEAEFRFSIELEMISFIQLGPT